jgi:hypothetical protein
VSITPGEMTPEEREKQQHRLATMKGGARKAKKVLSALHNVAKRTGKMWEWRVEGIRDDVDKLMAQIEAEEKKMK